EVSVERLPLHVGGHVRGVAPAVVVNQNCLEPPWEGERVAATVGETGLPIIRANGLVDERRSAAEESVHPAVEEAIHCPVKFLVHRSGSLEIRRILQSSPLLK